MQTPAETPSPSTSRPNQGRTPAGAVASWLSILWDTFRHLQIVLLVALVVATLFTAWTPGQYRPDSLEETFGLSPVARPTIPPTIGPTPTPRSRPLVGIVAGHWGNDSGAVCADGLTEVQLNQDIAARVQQLLVQRGFDVDLLKEFDPKLTGYQASALVSIHADSCDYINDLATGFKVASAMASTRPEQAARLTACLRSRYAQASGLPLHSTSVTNDMTNYHAFGEIDSNTIAAIIETGFMNLDRNFLTQFPDQAALGIANGIVCFINNESVSSPPPLPTPNPTP